MLIVHYSTTTPTTPTAIFCEPLPLVALVLYLVIHDTSHYGNPPLYECTRSKR